MAWSLGRKCPSTPPMVLGKIRSPGLAAFAIMRSRSFSISAVGTGNLRPLFCHRLPLSLKPRCGFERTHKTFTSSSKSQYSAFATSFLLTAACVQETAHPQFFFVVCRLEQRLEFMGFVRLDFLFFVVQLPQDLASEEDAVGTQEC